MRQAEILQAGSPDHEKLQEKERSHSSDLSVPEVQRVALDAFANREEPSEASAIEPEIGYRLIDASLLKSL